MRRLTRLTGLTGQNVQTESQRRRQHESQMSGDEGVVIKRGGVREWVSEEGRSEVGEGGSGRGIKKKRD